MKTPISLQRSWAQVAFCATAGAGAIHFAAARPHMQEWAPAGAFMLACGLAQVGWALWVRAAASPACIASGIALNAGIAGVWLVSRTAGMPIGPHAGIPEHVDASDALATALEVLAVVAAFGIGSSLRPDRALVALAAVGASLAALAGSHDPLREQVTAAAALVLAVTGRAVLHRLTPPTTRRRDDLASYAGRRAVRVRDAARAVLGAGGAGAG